MDDSGDRRIARGRRASDFGVAALRGALHDIGHDLATLNHLVDALASEDSLSVAGKRRIGLVQGELNRMTRVVRHALVDDANPVVINVRSLVEQLISVHAGAGGVPIALTGISDIKLHVDDTMLWRMLSNLVHNAMRAAGPTGHVEITIADRPVPTIGINDDGPGFGQGPSGWTGNGLVAVRQLAGMCGARLRFEDLQPHGTRAELAFNGQAGPQAPDSRGTGQ